MPQSNDKYRCEWVTKDPIYIAYHDDEWGKPEYDSQKLFEKICLEGQQTGLSWITILKKRQCYRDSFYYFDPIKIAKMMPVDIERLLTNPGLIRHRAKLNAIVTNAKAYLHMLEDGEDFSKFVWSFVDNTPKQNHFSSSSELPVTTEISDALARALKKKGFVFVGSTTCYAFMQSMGLVNDHTTHCYLYPKKDQ